MLLWSRYLLSLSLLPIVIPLGIRLRKTIIRLPEAPGKRRGFVGNAASTTFLLSLGESPIAGVGLEAQSQNLAPLLAKHLHQETSNQVEWQILGKSGLRIGQALPLFEPQLPPHADFIFISIGANDCKDATPVRQWVREWQRLLQHLRHRYPSAYIVCSSIPPFRCFPSLPYPVRAFLGRRSDLMNDLLRREIASLERSSFLLIPDIMTPDYFAEDGFHPNAKAHKEWAEGIFEELKRKKALG